MGPKTLWPRVSPVCASFSMKRPADSQPYTVTAASLAYRFTRSRYLEWPNGTGISRQVCLSRRGLLSRWGLTPLSDPLPLSPSSVPARGGGLSLPPDRCQGAPARTEFCAVSIPSRILSHRLGVG